MFFHYPSSFLNILNMKPERVNTDMLFHCEVRGHDWMKGTYSEKENKKKEKQRYVIRGKSNFQCICVVCVYVYVCVCACVKP